MSMYKMHRNQDGWIEAYKDMGALWIHDGNPKRPHAVLTSGKHSSGFFNSELVMEDPVRLDQATEDLTELLQQAQCFFYAIDRVVGPAMGAITLAHDMSRHIGRTRSRPCLRAYTEKEIDGTGKLMVFKRTIVHTNEQILLVEDVLTTGSSVDLTASAVLNAGASVLPFVAVLVNRTGLKEVNGRKIVALIDRPMPAWELDECELCKQGSEGIRPKGKENWARLNATY